MATIRGGKGVAILFFTIVIALFSWFIYFLAKGNTDPAYYWRQSAARQSAAQQSAARQSAPATIDTAADAAAIRGAKQTRLLLVRNEPQTIGKLKITYLGMANKHLLFDVHILDLDPSFAYRYAIPLVQAKERFRITDQYFQAHATSNSKIRLWQVALN
jgi:hypothetical protein